MPTYLQVKSLGLINTPYTLIILGGVSIYNIIITRVYFQTSIPESLYESATIDGASEWRNFIAIALPLAKPIIAVIALYYAVGRWNEYYNGLIYLSKSEYFQKPLLHAGLKTDFFGNEKFIKFNGQRIALTFYDGAGLKGRMEYTGAGLGRGLAPSYFGNVTGSLLPVMAVAFF